MLFRRKRDELFLREEDENGSAAISERRTSRQGEGSHGVYSRRKQRGEVEAFWYLRIRGWKLTLVRPEELIAAMVVNRERA